jgi:hypothetical protein
VGDLFQPGEISNPADDLLGDSSGNTVANTDVEATAATGGDFTMSLDAALSALVTEATTLASAVANGGATFTTAATTAATFTMEPAAGGATSAPGALPNLSLVSEQLKAAAILSSEQLLGLNSSGELFSTAPLIQQQQQMMPEATAVTTTQAAFSFVAGTPQLKVEEENRLLGTPTTTTHQQQVGWPLSYSLRFGMSSLLFNKFAECFWPIFSQRFYQCCGSVTFCNGSGSADPFLRLTDPDPALFVNDLQDAKKKFS